MYVLVTCKNDEDPKNEGTSLSQHYLSILICLRAANSIKGDGIWQKFKLIQACTGVLESCKNEEDPSKNEGCRLWDLAEIQTHSSLYSCPR